MRGLDVEHIYLPLGCIRSSELHNWLVHVLSIPPTYLFSPVLYLSLVLVVRPGVGVGWLTTDHSLISLRVHSLLTHCRSFTAASTLTHGTRVDAWFADPIVFRLQVVVIVVATLLPPLPLRLTSFFLFFVFFYA